MDAGVLLLHGLFEHKGRHQINSDWFENLNISPHSIDLPGHGEETTIKGHIDSWEENNEALKNGKIYQLIKMLYWITLKIH